jgi:hypothetical protein
MSSGQSSGGVPLRGRSRNLLVVLEVGCWERVWKPLSLAWVVPGFEPDLLDELGLEGALAGEVGDSDSDSDSD